MYSLEEFKKLNSQKKEKTYGPSGDDVLYQKYLESKPQKTWRDEAIERLTPKALTPPKKSGPTYLEKLAENRANAQKLGARVPATASVPDNIRELIFGKPIEAGTVNPRISAADFSTRYDSMTDREKAVYSHLKNTNAKDADEYLKAIDMDINQRNSEKRVADARKIAEERTAAGLYARFMGNNVVSNGAASAYELWQGLRNQPVDPNHPLLAGQDIVKGQNEAFVGDSTGIERYLREGAMGAFDFGINLMTAGAAGLRGQALQNMVKGSFAAQAFAGSAQDAAEREGAGVQSVLTGTASAALATIIEGIGLDRLAEIGRLANARSVLKSMARSILPEAAEEAVEEAGNILADAVIMGDKNEIVNLYNTARANGATQNDAVMGALGAAGKRIGESAIIGGISGGMIGGGVAMTNRALGGNALENDVPDTNVGNTEVVATDTNVGGTQPQNPTAVHETAIPEELDNSPAEMRTQPTEAQTSRDDGLEDYGEKFYGAKGAETYLKKARESGNFDHTSAFNTYYRAGVSGIREDEIKQTAYTAVADKAMLHEAYMAGAADSADEIANAIKGRNKLTGKRGLILGEDVKATDAQMALADFLGKTGGVQIRLVNKLEVTNDKGEVVGSANGKIEDGVITIALDADTFTGTAIHEMVHHIRKVNPAGYDAMRKLVFETANKIGVNMDKVMADYESTYRAAYGDKTSMMDIMEEVTADGFQKILNDKNAYKEFVNELQKADKSLVAKIKEFLDKLMKTIESLMKDNRYTSFADALGEDLDSVKKLRKMFAEVLAETGKMETGSEGVAAEGKFSMKKPVEETKNLIAVHGIHEANLKKVLDIGGFAMPSIAIIKDSMDHSKYGEISVVFGKETIDPKNKKNAVYGGDAWTPTIPSVNYAVDQKKMNGFEREIAKLASKVLNGMFAYSSLFGSMGVDEWTDNTQNQLAHRLADRDPVMAAYAADKGIDVEIAYRKAEYDKLGNAFLHKVINHFGHQKLAEMEAELELGNRLSEEDVAAIREMYRKNWIAKLPDVMRRKRTPEQIVEKSHERANNDVQTNRAEDIVRNAWMLYEDGGATTSEVDRLGTQSNLQRAVNHDDVAEWVMPKLDGLLGDGGIYNGKDRFTDSGKRRTFKQLHYPYTLENLVKAMKANQKERGESLWGATARGLHSVATPKYGSIADIKADSDRLQTMSEEEYQAKLDEIDARINKVIEEVKATNEPHNSNPFWEADIISEVLIEAAQKGSANAVKATFAKEDYQITDELAKEIYDMARAAGKLPTGYFEAKPQRAVGFDEVRAVVVPNTMDQATRSRLEGEGMNVIEYTAGDEESRKEALNSVPDVKFSVKDQKYLEAVENKDMETAEEMVLEAAKAAGYNSPILYHGTDQFGFTEIDFRKSDDHTSFFMVDTVGTAQSYAGTDRVRSIRNWSNEDEMKDAEDDKYNEIFEESQKIYRCRGKYGEDIGYKCYDLAVEIAQGGIDAGDAEIELYEFCGEIFEEIYNELWGPDELSFEDFEDDRGDEFYSRVGVVNDLMLEYAELIEGIESPYGIYKLVANTDNFLEIDAEGRNWNDIRWESGEGRYNTTRSVAEYANSKGYNGVIFKNIYDHGRYGGDRKAATVYIAFDGKLVKSADTVTYDESGEVIPLSERFDPEKKDIRWSVRESGLDRIEKEYKDKTDYLFLHENDDAVFIDNMVVKNEYRGQGVGNQIVSDVIAYADARGKIVALTPTSEFGTKNKLTKWYKKHGFVENKGKNTDFRFRDTMYRLPRSVKFSMKKESVEANIAGNDHWKAAYEGLLREFEITKEPLKDKESARRVVRKFLKEIKSGYSEEDFLNRFIDLCNYGADMQSDSDYKDLVTAMTMLVEDALKESAELDMEMYNQYADLRAELRNGKIKVTADMMKDLEAQDRKYPDLRRENFSRVQMSSKDGGAIDTKYAAWAEEYPELFKLDQHTSQAELLLDVVAIRDSLDPVVKNPYFDQLSDYAESYAYELLGRMNDIALEKPTFADKYEAKLKKLRDENKEALRRVREQAKNEKELLRKKYADNAEARLEATKKKYEKRMDRKEYWRLRKLAEKDAKALAEWLKKPTDKNHVPKKFKASVETVLALIETERPDIRIRLQDFVAMKSGLTELYGDGQGIFLYREKDERVVDILDMFIQKYPNGANLDAMTASEMKYFRQLIASVKKACTDANKLHTSAREKTTVELSEEYINEAQKKKDAKETGIIRRINDFLGLEMLDANSFFKRIGGNVYSELWKGLRKGMDKKVLRWKEALDFINELVDPETVREWTDEPAKEFEIGGVKVYLSIPQIMSLSCLMRRNQGRQHIVGAEIATETGILRVRGGGFKADILEGDKAAKKEKPKVVEPTEEEVKAIIGSLTEEQARVAYQMQKFLSENVAAWGNETTMLLFGYERFGEANYFPIVSDKNFVNEQVTKTDDIAPTLRSMGLTKNLNQYANNPVIIQDIFKVFANHVDQMSNYNAFVPSESDFNKFLNFKMKNKEGRVFSVKDEMDRIMGKGGVKYIKNLMNRLVTANGLSDDIDLGKMLLRNMKVASVAANLRVILQQPTAYFRALNYIDPKYLLNPAVFKKADLNDVYENAPIALWKNWGNYEMDTGKSMYDQIIAPTKVGWTKDMMLAGAGWMDKRTWLRLWNACLLEARSENPKATDEEVKSIAGERFSEIVDESQVVDSVLHRSQIMRRKGLYTQMITSFLSEPTKTFNMASNALVEVVRNNTPENRKKFIRCYSTLILSGVLTACAAGLADAMRDDDDEDEFLKKWMRAVAGDVSEAETAKEVVMARLNSNIGDNLNPLGMLPFLRDVWSSFQGYDVKRTDFAWLNDVLKNMNRWMKFIEGESEYTLQAMLLNTAGAWSKLTGLPVSSATRELKSIANVCVYHFAYGEPGEYTEAEFAYQKLGKAIGSEKNASYYIDRMLKAYMNGDRKLATKIYNEMIRAGIDNQKIDGKVESKMKSAMKDNPDILEAANAMANGDVKTLEAMADKMMSLGFRESEVASAINSAYNAMDDTEEELTYEEIDESYWGSGAKTVDDLMDNKMMFNAHKAGSTSNYDKIREKRIQAKMNDGKTRKEAENSVRTSMRNQYKAMYEKALEEGDSAAMKEARSGHREFGGKDSTLDKLH